METETKNLYLRYLIRLTKKTARHEGAPIWEDVAELLSRSNRSRPTVNLFKLNRVLENDSTAIVPGKVLGKGVIDKKIKVAAYNFSAKARKKIEEVGGTAIPIEKLIEENPNGSNVRIII